MIAQFIGVVEMVSGPVAIITGVAFLRWLATEVD